MITPDLVASLGFPTVAAFHLVYQAKLEISEAQTWNRVSTLAQTAASTEAALNVAQTALGQCVLGFSDCVNFKSVRRGFVTAAVGLFCFSAESHL